MLENIIYISPLIVLLSSIFIITFSEYKPDEQYRCFKFTKITLLFAFILTVIFYNKPLIYSITQGNYFTLFFETLLYISSFALLYLSRKWFIAKDIPAYKFCICLCTSVLCGSLLIRSTNLALTDICCIAIMLCNYQLLSYDSKRDNQLNTGVYRFSIIICCILLIFSVIIFYLSSGSLMYNDLHSYIDVHHSELPIFFASCTTLLSFSFLIGLAPLHFWFTEALGKTILPVFIYFILVPICSYFAGIIKFNIKIISPLADYFTCLYTSISLLSITIGAIGTCSGKNIRKILAYSSVYHLGVIFLILPNPTYLSSGLIYLISYMLAMYGICACLLGLKSKGEYLFTLSEFEGAAHKRPYISAMMSVFLFSLLGFPPFLGFIGYLSVFSSLVDNGQYLLVIYLLIAMLGLLYSYLRLIKTFYSDNRRQSFDYIDTSIYIAVMLNAILMIFLVLKPHYLIENLIFVIGEALI